MNYQADKINQLDIKINSKIQNDEQLVNVVITAPEASEKRDPVAIICVLDISGSMDCEATQSNAESDGFTRLDLVKHSVNTIINTLEPDDLLGIVTFSNNARVDFELNNMTEAGKNKAMEVIKKMKTEGATNLWDGIYNGLELSKNQKCDNKNTFVVVLSDGQPNQHPPNGEWMAAMEYSQKNQLKCNMSMFGYGYHLDTNLLSALTQVGGGCFGYIPDCSMIGTIFVNFLSAALSSFSPRLSILVNNDHSRLIEMNGVAENQMNLGMIQYGMSRNCLLKFKTDKVESLTNLEIQLGSKMRESKTLTIQNQQKGSEDAVMVQKFRFEQIRLLTKSIQDAKNNLNNCLHQFKTHAACMEKYQDGKAEPNQYVGGLIHDIVSEVEREGQISIALSQLEFWNKWGLHYFHALKIAHQIEMATNFKDPGLQNYGGKLFKSLQDSIDTIFIKLPPPQPSIQKYDQNGNLKQVYSMDDYYDVGGGCIHHQCLVTMKDGGKKKIEDLCKGDEVKGGKVICVVKTSIQGLTKMSKFDEGLMITAYHPIKMNGKWDFPINCAQSQQVFTKAYYNFVIEGISMEVNGIECITLAHNIKGDKVAEHAYFGTQKIVDDLKQMKGWEEGMITLEGDPFKRNSQTMLVEGMQEQKCVA